METIQNIKKKLLYYDIIYISYKMLINKNNKYNMVVKYICSMYWKIQEAVVNKTISVIVRDKT